MRLLVTLSFLIAFSSSTEAQQKKVVKPVPIIFDTDIGPDYDDIGAIAMLHALADKGECKILATIARNKHSLIAAAL